MSTIFKKSREGLHFVPEVQQSLAETWETLRHQCVIEKGSEIQTLSYNFEQILGVAFDGSNMTRETCGLAVVDDQLSQVTDVILDKGIEAVPDIAGAIQRKERFVREWVVAYDMHRNKFNKTKPMRTALGEPYKEAWDSWPEKVWKSDNDSVVLVQTDIQQDRIQRTRGVLQCVWNNVRSMVRTPRQETPAVAVKEEEPEGGNEPVNRPTYFTGELPQNTIVDISALNRPDQTAFIEAVNQPPRGYEEKMGAKRVMALKAPFAFEWPENSGWNAQQRLDHRLSIESNKNPKIWDTSPGAAAKNVAAEIEKLNAVKWTKKGAEDIYVRAAEKAQRKLSDKEMTLFRWMCFHIYFGWNTASCGYTKYVPELDAWSDEYMSRVTDMDPLPSEEYEWCANKRNAVSMRLVWVVSQLMNAYQRHHIDLRSALALTDSEWELVVPTMAHV